MTMTIKEIIENRIENDKVKREWKQVDDGWLTVIHIRGCCLIMAKEDGWPRTTIRVFFMTPELQDYLESNHAIKDHEHLYHIPVL